MSPGGRGERGERRAQEGEEGSAKSGVFSAACTQCLAWGHPCWLATGDVEGGSGELGAGSNSSLAPAKDKSFDFAYLLARRPPWAPSELTWRSPQAAKLAVLPNLVTICPSLKWDTVLPALLQGFPKGMRTQHWSQSLWPRQEAEGLMMVNLSSLWLP